MPNDKQKLIMIMHNLESDYKNGRISPEKFKYLHAKYEDKLSALDAREATNRIRAMQGKSVNHGGKSLKRAGLSNKKEEQDLVQKYIVNPKKGDNDLRKKKKPLDSGTFKLIAILVLLIGFTCGIGFGIFNLDFESVAATPTSSIVEDTAFPDVDKVEANVTNATDNGSTTIEVNPQDDTSSYDSSNVAQEDMYVSDDGGSYPDNGQQNIPSPAPEENQGESGESESQGNNI